MPEVLFYIPREMRLKMLFEASKSSRDYLFKYWGILSRETNQEAFNLVQRCSEVGLKSSQIFDLPEQLKSGLVTTVVCIQSKDGFRVLVGGWCQTLAVFFCSESDGKFKLEKLIETPDILYCSLKGQEYLYLGLRQGLLLRIDTSSMKLDESFRRSFRYINKIIKS